MAQTLNLGTDGNWAVKKDSLLAYNSENGNFKPLPFDFTRASSATVVNKDGLIETVGSGKARIDFKDDAKGALLLEPTRSNLITYSEDFSQWTSAVITELPSSEISPNGSLSAYNLNGTIAYSSSFVSSISINSGSNYTFSFWVKNATDDGKLGVRLVAGSNDVRYIFNINNKTSTPFINYISGFVSSNIEEYSNGWYRCSLTVLSNGTTATAGLYPKYIDKVEENSIDVFGAQLEQGSYATSYIPTQGSAVTRVADVCNGAGNNQVINSTEGVLYAEISALANDGTTRRLSISDGTTSNRIVFSYSNVTNQFQSFLANPSVQFNFLTTLSNSVEFNKIAVKYKQNDFALWINGVKVATDTNGTVANGLNTLNFDEGSGASDFYGNIKDLRVYNTALTDAELQALTQ